MGKLNNELLREMRANGFVTVEEAARRVKRSKWTMYYWAKHVLSAGNVKRSGKAWFLRLSAVKLLSGGRP